MKLFSKCQSTVEELLFDAMFLNYAYTHTVVDKKYVSKLWESSSFSKSV